MSFMKKEIFHGKFFTVETTHGTETVPTYLLTRTEGLIAEALANYCTGNILDPDEDLVAKEGWLARMSAPGYMDCTDWTSHASEKEANEYLDALYGDENDC